MTFTTWFNEIADMPAKEDGVWYDMEDGVRFDAWNTKTARIKKEKSSSELRYGHLKVNALREQCVRLVKSQEYSINKYQGAYNVDMLLEVVEAGKNIDNMKKAELFEFIEMNSKASRLMNKEIQK